MKKKLLTLPLLVVPFLVNCGGGDNPPPPDPTYHTLKFEGKHCVMKDDSGKVVIQKAFEGGQDASFHLEGETIEFGIPKEEDVKFTYTATGEPFDGTYSYNAADGSLSVRMTADITVTASSEELEWYENEKYISSLNDNDIGITKTIKVNGLDHTVRLIGIDHDNLVSNGKAHTTWEFANLISDENGHSLALTYDDNDNTHFIDSHLRKAIDGEGEYANDIRWYQKDEDDDTTPSEDYKNKSIIDMLPTKLVNKMKTVVKKVVKDGGKIDPTTTTYDTKLFILSKEEYFTSLEESEGSEKLILKDEGDTYSFYADLDDNDIAYIHKQVAGEDICDKHSVDKTGDIWTYAGYNLASDNTGGGRFWLRSPYHIKTPYYGPNNAYMMEAKAETGEETEYNPLYIWDRADVSIEAYGVAPAFCI